ncbi:MAG TPA: hypothetical protein VK906_13400 [Egicoccus sp.]|nr:hypothetical protein [Egicoccus sp.]HSK24175.1 hypothetical protein [Egicoccus sp.]
MPTRTYLTTPPGREPALHGSPDGVVELWVPGLEVPVEPAPPRRGRAVVLIGLAAALTALTVYLVVGAVTGARAEDPSLSASAGQGQQ